MIISNFIVSQSKIHEIFERNLNIEESGWEKSSALVCFCPTSSPTYHILNLIKAPENIIDYIILHELCHLKIKEHSHHYWDLLHKYMPNYYDKVEWLKVNGNNLI
ncbi:MAG TPA: M48 family metallopeptidase [Nitrososphaeraceae archaeon]|nr:M48 family metallopeptidase [Nitrososphaeraceae archaeon]